MVSIQGSNKGVLSPRKSLYCGRIYEPEQRTDFNHTGTLSCFADFIQNHSNESYYNTNYNTQEKRT